MVGRQPVDHRHLCPVGKLRDHLVRPRPHDDRLHVAGQDARRVGHRLASRELELVAPQDQRRAAQLGHPDLERDARARRGLLEHQRDALARERVGSLARSTAPPSAPARGRAARSARRGSSSSPVRKWRAIGSGAWYAAERTILRPWRSAPSPGTCSTAATFRPTRRFTRGARAWRGRPSATPPTSRSTGSCFAEFAEVLCAARWDVALLQECPPRWSAPLAAACEASAHRSLTSRNWLGPIRSVIAGWNPDLLGSWEGGSNLTLFRGRVRTACSTGESWSFAAFPSDARWPSPGSTRGSAWRTCTRARRPRLAAADVRHAAETAVAWAGDSPLILGGDFNLRPSQTPLFEELARRFGLSTPTGPDSHRPHPRPRARDRRARRAPGRPRRGSCPARASDCASPTTPRSRRGSPALGKCRCQPSVDPPAAGMR